MRKRTLLMLLITTTLLAACGGSKDVENNLEEDSSTSVDNDDDELIDDSVDEEDIDDDENDVDEYALVDVSLDISESITEAYDFYDEIYFSDTEIIDEEIGLKSANVTVYSDSQSHNIAILRAHTIEPENSITLSVNINPEDYENKLAKKDADGNKMAVEVAEDTYEYAEKLMWKEEENVFQIDGGRSVISTVKENEIHPEEDRLLFYENLVPTNDELKTYDEFYQNIKVPTRLPEGFSLYRVSLFYEQPGEFSNASPARILYEVRSPNNESIMFEVYGEYEEAPKLKGDNVREENILETPVQADDETLLFTLDDETYEIFYMEVPEETIFEIAESIIEQAE